jgi:hypothetical protein
MLASRGVTMSSFFDPGPGADEVDNPSNPGNDPNFDAGDLHAENAAEAQAAGDYDQHVGSDEHEAEGGGADNED